MLPTCKMVALGTQFRKGVMIVPAKALMVKAKKKKEFIPLSSMPSRLECPKCGEKLRILIAGTAGQIYICTKCGYRGSVGLEPGVIKLDRKRSV